MNNKNIYGKANYNDEMTKTAKILACVLIALGLVYFLTALATGEINFGKKNEVKEETTIQYEEIISGETFNRQESEYYVLLMNFTDKYASTALQIKGQYEDSTNALKVYTMDLDKNFNSGLITDGEIKENPANINELRVKSGMTLLKIKDKKVIKRVESYEKIKDYLLDLVK